MLKRTLLVLTLGFSSLAQADVSSALQNICNIVKADDKRELRKKMKKVQAEYSLKLQDYYSAISCGGNSLIRTAFVNGSLATGSLLIKKMPKSILNTPQADGSTIRAWAVENGYTDSELLKVLNNRI